MKRQIFEAIRSELSAGRPAEIRLEADGQTYVRKWTPQKRLLILGGGHIALALCKMASMLDFAVTVADDRPEFSSRERFPEAAETFCGGYEEAIERFRVQAADYVCVITRGHAHDGDCLRAILPGTMPRYLGMIGSRKRTGAQLDLLEREGISRERLNAIHTPIGLPINAQTPAEIAVSILAELVQVYREGCVKSGGEETVVLPRTDVDTALLEDLARGAGERMAAVVLSTLGSTPAMAGAMMSVSPDGSIRGTVGGGSGEGAVIRAAGEMFGHEARRVVEISMTNDVAADEGMACGGSMKVLIEAVE